MGWMAAKGRSYGNLVGVIGRPVARRFVRWTPPPLTRVHLSAPVALGGVPETLLWPLYDRASWAARPGALLHAHRTIEIYRSIDTLTGGRQDIETRPGSVCEAAPGWSLMWRPP